MKKEKQRIAIVMDEYGGMTGIVTLNDLVEQLVGDLGDDEIEEETLIELIGEDTWQVNGSVTLEEVSKVIGVSLENEDYDTLNGLIFHTLGSIPEDGSDIELQVSGLLIKATDIQNCQIETAVISRL